MTTAYAVAKRSFDVVAAGAGLVASIPLLAIVTFAVRRDLGSPVLFRQQRVGRGGETFELVKFRTMRDGLDDDGARLTRLGRLLRTTSIDELPTLVHVLRGQMSLVGPRPLLPQYLGRYSERQARRHLVRPGVTGWAQVNGRNALEWDERLEADVWYVENCSFGLDLKILLRTVSAVVVRRGISAPGHETMPEFSGTASG